MKITYEIRTMRDRPVYVFDSLANAKVELKRSEKRIGTKLRLIEVTHTEKELEL